MTKHHKPDDTDLPAPTPDDAPAEDLLLKIDELTNALQRERADADNIRRRHSDQLTDLKRIVKSELVRELLPFIDNFERAQGHAPKPKPHDPSDDAWVKWFKGLESVTKQLGQAFDKMGVERIKTVGEPFDPRYHEAISMEDGDGTHEVVAEELQSGYKIGDEVIRHAMVRVKLA